MIRRPVGITVGAFRPVGQRCCRQLLGRHRFQQPSAGTPRAQLAWVSLAQCGIQRSQRVHATPPIGNQRLHGEHRSVADDQRFPRISAPRGKEREQVLQPCQILHRCRPVGHIPRQHAIVERDSCLDRHRGGQFELLAIGTVIPTIAIAHQFSLLIVTTERDRGDVIAQLAEIEIKGSDGGDHQIQPEGIQMRSQHVEGAG